VAKHSQQKVRFASTIWSSVIAQWQKITVEFLLGAVLGFGSSTVRLMGSRLGENSLGIVNKYFREITVWPKGGVATLVVILCVAAFFYAVRLIVFLKKLWKSLRSGLVSGIGVVWFLTSAVAFTFFNLTGSRLSLLLLGVGVAGTLVVFYRDANSGKETEELLEADPYRPISAIDEDILHRGSVVASVVRAIVDDLAPVVALTGAYPVPRLRSQVTATFGRGISRRWDSFRFADKPGVISPPPQYVFPTEKV
jgi:hypothetical protein